MDKTPLSANQEKVYKFLVKRLQNGLPPTVREICEATGLKSTSSVHAILNFLEENDYIVRDPRFSRAIRLNADFDSAMVPLVGKITAGQPILAVEQIEDYIPYPSNNAEGLFALKVVGLSMKNAGILDGDIVIADKNAPCKSGDIIIGMDGDSATVKRLSLKDGQVVFLPENPDFKPIYPKDPKVLGKVIGSFRKY
ncbi:MAG: repressor LexA [Clostridia bacterium]|nr:repressor LexA [Clostridia bacterium]